MSDSNSFDTNDYSSGDSFCCCEYKNQDGKKSHLMAVCCECDLIDETCDRILTCKPLPPAACSRIMGTIMDRLRMPWFDGQGARRIDFDVLLALIFMPVSLIIASQGPTWSMITFSSLLCFLFIIYIRRLKTRPDTVFFVAWSVISLIVLLGVFEIEVVPFLEILFYENFLLMFFISIMCYCGFMIRQSRVVLTTERVQNEAVSLEVSDDKWPRCQICNIMQPPKCCHCRLCGHCVLRRNHHSIWLNACIGAKNYKYYIVGLVALMAACFYGANLTLTTICHPFLMWDVILMPDNCEEVYDDFHIALCYVGAIYAVMIGLFALVKLVVQVCLLCFNTSIQECCSNCNKVCSKGVTRDCVDFWCGYY